MNVKLCFYNDHFNPYFYSKNGYKGWKKVSEETKRVNTERGSWGTLRLTKYAVEDSEVYTFGLLYDNPARRPGHGGEWSSNGTYIAEEFGIELMPIGMDGIAAHMRIDDVLKFFPPEFFVEDVWLKSRIVEGKWMAWYNAKGELATQEELAEIN